jgi:polyvinyl alcohol dehydrogenase (cytochrome)
MKNMMRLTVVIAGFILYGTLAQNPVSAQTATDWPMFGQNIGNTASNSSETTISAGNAATLQQTWAFTTGGDVTARAAVVGGVVYFPDWGGNLTAVDASKGSPEWSHPLTYYGLAAGTVSRTSPAVVNGVVYVGTQYVSSGATGWLLAINATGPNAGELIWKVQPDTSNPFPVITGSPAVANGIVYVSMTSNEEFAAGLDPNYPCCSASGSVVALSTPTGTKLWQTFTVPKGYSGGAVWGSNPVVDTARGTVFVGTGNNYSHPTDPKYVTCVNRGTGTGNESGNGKGNGSGNGNGNSQTEATCLSPDDHADSILALDMYTGAIKWATRLMNWNQYGVVNGSDDWNTACFIPPFTNCPTSSGPDYDFGSAPNEITYQSSNGPKTIIGAGQKSGIYYALDPDTGAVLWATQVGPGSSLGGIEWGSATDGTRIYVAIANLYAIPYGPGNAWRAGSWAALDPASGAILWQIPDPNGAIDIGPMTVANGVVYAGSMGFLPPNEAQPSTMFGLNAANGHTLWSFAPGSSVNAGATVVNGVVYWGSGYSHLGSFLGSGNNKFFAFSPSSSH